jgi:RNA polymerase sigma-70 factor, ECF subfamily
MLFVMPVPSDSALAAEDLTLSELVVAAQLGDTSAGEALARRFLRPAYAVALSILRRPSDAEDVAQDALIIALLKIQDCRAPSAFGAWLMQIVRNQALNLRSKRILRDVPEQQPEEIASPRASGDTLTRMRLLKALDHLTEQQREVVLLHDLAGFHHMEIAKTLDISNTNSRQILFVARAVLRRYLER